METQDLKEYFHMVVNRRTLSYSYCKELLQMLQGNKWNQRHAKPSVVFGVWRMAFIFF